MTKDPAGKPETGLTNKIKSSNVESANRNGFCHREHRWERNGNDRVRGILEKAFECFKKAGRGAEKGRISAEERRDCAYAPKSVSWSEVVGVDPERLLCDCNVFRTRKACPHVAAMLGKREDNGGKLPVTDARQYVKECLEELEKTAAKKPEYLRGYVEPFTSRVGFLIVDLSWKDRQHLLLELARILNAPEWMR